MLRLPLLHILSDPFTFVPLGMVALFLPATFVLRSCDEAGDTAGAAAAMTAPAVNIEAKEGQ